jgi:hypothetical protein
MNHSCDEFLLKENIQMLWEIVSDKDSSPQVEHMFREMVFEFAEREKRTQPNLLAMNKYFITTFVTLLNTMKNAKPPEKALKKPVTQEQWQEQRKTQFESELATMKRDLASVLQPAVPSAPKFTEDIDAPMDDRIMKQRIAEREREYDTYKPPPPPSTKQVPPSSENRIQNVLKELEKLVQPEKVSIRIEDQPIAANVLSEVEELGDPVSNPGSNPGSNPVSNPVSNPLINSLNSASLNSASLNASLNSASLNKRHISWGSNEERIIESAPPDLNILYDMLMKQQVQLDSLVQMVTELYELEKESK